MRFCNHHLLYFSGECGVNDQCGNKEAGCQNDHECKNELVCGVEDNICQTNCSLDLCKLQEGICMANDECKDDYICGINNRCRGKLHIFCTNWIVITDCIF